MEHSSPPDWVCFGFPLPVDGGEVISTEQLVAGLMRRMQSARLNDPYDVGPVLHAAHWLKSRQQADWRWPAAFNLKTGEPVSCESSTAPAAFLRALDQALNSSEFSICYANEDAGGGTNSVEMSG